MTKRQELDLAISEKREELHKTRKEIEALSSDTPAEQRAEANSKYGAGCDELIALEQRWRDAVQAEVEAADKAKEERSFEDGLTPEVRELQGVENRVSFGAAIRQATGDETASGAEKELRDALDLTMEQVPWNVFVPRPEDRKEDPLEERQDTTVATPTSLQSYQNAIIRRVFSAAALSFLGVMPRMVGTGKQLHLVITTGGTPSFVAKDAGRSFQAGILSPFETAPKRLTTGYRIAQVDLYQVTGLESTLRDDASRAISDRLDYEVLQGSTAAGFYGFLSSNAASLPVPGAGGSPSDFDDAVEQVTSALDGRYARVMGQVRTLVNPAVGQRFESQFRGDSELSVAGWCRDQAGGVMVSANMPAGSSRAAVTAAVNNSSGYTAGANVIAIDGSGAAAIIARDTISVGGNDYRVVSRSGANLTLDRGLVANVANDAVVTRGSSTNNDVIVCKAGPGARDNTVLDIWQGVRVTRDNLTESKEGNIRLVLDTFADFKITREDGFVRAQIPTA